MLTVPTAHQGWNSATATKVAADKGLFVLYDDLIEDVVNACDVQRRVQFLTRPGQSPRVPRPCRPMLNLRLSPWPSLPTRSRTGSDGRGQRRRRR